MEAIAIGIGSLVIAAAGFLVASKNSSRVDLVIAQSAEMNIRTVDKQTIEQLSKRVDALQNAVERCEAEKSAVTTELIKTLAARKD